MGSVDLAGHVVVIFYGADVDAWTCSYRSGIRFAGSQSQVQSEVHWSYHCFGCYLDETVLSSLSHVYGKKNLSHVYGKKIGARRGERESVLMRVHTLERRC